MKRFLSIKNLNKRLFYYFTLLVCLNLLSLCAYLQFSDYANLEDLAIYFIYWIQGKREQKVEYLYLTRLLQNQNSKDHVKYDSSFLDLKSNTNQFDFEKCWSDKSHSMKFVALNELTVGYGNRLYAFLNALALAILTESKLILNWEHVDKYVDILKDYQNNKLNFVNSKHKLYSSEPEKIVYDTNTVNAWAKSKNISIIINSSYIPSSFQQLLNSSKNNQPIVLEIQNYNPLFFELLAGSSSELTQFRSKLSKCGLLDEKIVNEANKEENRLNINVMFSVGFNFANSILNRLWVPSEKSLKQIINKYMTENEFESSFVIGLQMRFGYMSYGSDVENMIKCAINVEKMLLSKNEKRRVKWFIAADSDRYLRKIKQNINDNLKSKVISLHGRIAHIDKNGGGYERTVLDNEILSRCNELIITGGSTFGM
jgi:hypothetical protein